MRLPWFHGVITPDEKAFAAQHISLGGGRLARMDKLGAILIIDDDVDYSCLLQVALLEAPVANPVEVINDGCAAMQYLKTLGNDLRTASHYLALVLLDLRMPKFSGLGVLRWMRSEPYLAAVPVVVCTGLEAGDEPSQALALGAATLLEKPFCYRELLSAVRNLRDRFLSHPELRQAA